MSSRNQPDLHIEWSPGQARAIRVSTGETRQAARIADLGSVLAGQKEALVGVGRGNIFLKTLRLPKAGPEDLRRILSVQVGQLFPLPSDQLAFDFYQTDNQTADGCLTLIAAIRSQDLAELRAELSQANLRASRILPVALASPAVARRQELSDALVLDEVPGGLALDVVQEGVLRFSRIASGTSDPHAEARRTLAAANASPLPLLASAGVPVSDAIPSATSPLALLQEAPPFAFELAAERLKARQKQIALRTRFAVLMMAAACLLAVLIWVERSEAQAVVTRSQGTWARELGKLRSIRDSENKSAQQRMAMQKALDSALDPKQPLSDVAAVIGDALPGSVWLTGLSIERGKPIQIRGTASQSADVARLVDSLGNNPRFREVKLVFANSAKIEETQVVQFSITAVAVGNLPMPAPEKKTKATRATAARKSATATAEKGAAQ